MASLWHSMPKSYSGTQGEMMRSVTTVDAVLTTRVRQIEEALDANDPFEAIRLIRLVRETEPQEPTPGDSEARRAFTSALPPMPRTCLTLHFEGDKNEAIAQKMGLPVETVHHMLSETLFELQKHVG
jgi:DNA-directed RNA polymerase specialized sigma24 family protein